MDNNENNYIAITIGPIMDTMDIVTKPGALWLSSYMFSYISKRLCVEIGAKVGVENIISPYICEAQEKELYEMLMERKDGVGLFHDHIIFREAGDIWGSLNGIRESVLAELAEKLGVDKNDLFQYLMIKACRFSLPKGENPILYCGGMLDSLELPKVFREEEKEHPLKKALGNKEAKNIAEAFGVEEKTWSLIHDKEIETENGKKKTVRAFKDIPTLAFREENMGYKKNNYYCMLRADGDNVSKIIAGLNGDGECREFSRACLTYCSEVANKVNAYGGITIYAGGDDLLAIVPCEGNTGNVLGLICEIDRLFNKTFENYINAIIETNNTKAEKIPVPSLSFGALICHEKHPLYETVSRSADLLYEVAKKKNGGKKNCLAIQLQKRSGQSEELLMQKDSLVALEKLLADILTDEKNSANGVDNFLLSASHKIIVFKNLFESIKGTNGVDINKTFENLFDASYHFESENRKNFLYKTLPNFYKDHCLNGDILLLENDEEVYQSAKALGQALRVIKFFTEKGAE